MSTAVADAPPPPPGPRLPWPYGRPGVAWLGPLLAWLVVAAAVAFVLARNYLTPPSGEAPTDTAEIQGRSLVGFADLKLEPGAALYAQAKDLNRGSTAQRLRFAVLAGELKGPDEALQQLDALQAMWERGELAHSEDDAETADVLRRLYKEYAAGDLAAADVDADQRKVVTDHLGWFGRLALAPAGGPDAAERAAVLEAARRAAEANLGLVAVVVGGCVLGLILVILAVICWRWLRLYFFFRGAPYGGVYAETFALWMVLFLGLGYLTRKLPPSPHALLILGLANLSSLAALAWPVLRGVPWRRVRRDVGWDLGARPPLEPLCGLACYFVALPLVVVAALFIVAVMQLQQRMGWQFDRGPLAPPGHPATGLALHSNWWGRVQLLFVASVAAPILEETMFRGVLYRHLREATGRLGRGLSFALSALSVSFIFAVIHPQGLLGVPVLMALASGFATAREWRNSLIPSMTAHALNNAAVLWLTILLAG
jgi:membrane protease YdiL (CAAX protease family)